MTTPLIVIDRSQVRDGRLQDVRTAFDALLDFVEEHEPRTLVYSVAIDDEEGTATVLQVHPDSASMEHHLRVAAEAFREFADLLQLRSMDVYGEPSDTLLGLIRAKVDLLGPADLVLHRSHVGFARISSR